MAIVSVESRIKPSHVLCGYFYSEMLVLGIEQYTTGTQEQEVALASSMLLLNPCDGLLFFSQQVTIKGRK